MFLAIPPATLFHGILALATGMAKAKAAGGRGGAHPLEDKENPWLAVLSEIATVMFAHSFNDDYVKAREHLMERLTGFHTPEGGQLERAIARSAIIADVLCLMEALPETAESGPIAALARRLRIAGDPPQGILSAGGEACVRTAKSACETRLQNLSVEFERRGIDAHSLLAPVAADESASLGRQALAELESAEELKMSGCGRLPERAEYLFETKWTSYLFAVFQEE